jgi:hypothetical protein
MKAEGRTPTWARKRDADQQFAWFAYFAVQSIRVKFVKLVPSRFLFAYFAANKTSFKIAFHYQEVMDPPMDRSHAFSVKIIVARSPSLGPISIGPTLG